MQPNTSIEKQVKELERSFPELRQKLDIRLIPIIGHLASRFTGNNDKDLALLRGNMEYLYKPSQHDALWKNVEDERGYTLRLIEYVRLYQSEMKRLFH